MSKFNFIDSPQIAMLDRHYQAEEDFLYQLKIIHGIIDLVQQQSKQQTSQSLRKIYNSHRRYIGFVLNNQELKDNPSNSQLTQIFNQIIPRKDLLESFLSKNKFQRSELIKKSMKEYKKSVAGQFKDRYESLMQKISDNQNDLSIKDLKKSFIVSNNTLNNLNKELRVINILSRQNIADQKSFNKALNNLDKKSRAIAMKLLSNYSNPYWLFKTDIINNTLKNSYNERINLLSDQNELTLKLIDKLKLSEKILNRSFALKL
ncbi:MAG: hypothetical protein AB8B67_00810 [Rickettsiaceae bacterium]